MRKPPFYPFLRNYQWLLHIIGLLPTVLMLALVAVFFGTGTELAAFFMAYRMEHSMLTRAMLVVTHGTAPVFYCVYAWLLFQGLRTRNRQLVHFVLIYAVVQLLVAFLLVRLIKFSVGKPRPMSLLAGCDYEPFSLKHGQHSFPSGHTTEITGASLSLLRLKRDMAFSFGMGWVIALVGFSRIYLGMHHITDVLCALAFGSLTVVLVHYFSTWERYAYEK